MESLMAAMQRAAVHPEGHQVPAAQAAEVLPVKHPMANRSPRRKAKAGSRNLVHPVMNRKVMLRQRVKREAVSRKAMSSREMVSRKLETRRIMTSSRPAIISARILLKSQWQSLNRS